MERRPAAPPALRSASPVWIPAALLAAWLVGSLVVAPLALAWTSPASAAGRLFASWNERWWDGAVILAALAAMVPMFAALRLPRAAEWVPPATAEALGATRMWIALILLGSVLWEDLPSSAALPRGMLDLDRHWIIGSLHALPIGFDRFLASAPALAAFQGLAALLLAAAAAGLATRWTVPSAAVAYLLFAAILRGYAWSYHMGLVPLYALLLLSFTPCGDAWSLDRRRRARAGLPVVPAREPHLRYSLGRLLVWMAVALPYTMAGLSKIRRAGLGWWDGENMKQMVVGTIVEPMHFDFAVTYRMLAWPDPLWDALGLAALLGEVLFVLVLVSRIARLILPAVTAGMHVGILLMQNILFPDLIAIQAVFYDWTPLRRRVAGWLPTARERADVLAPPTDAGARRLAGVARGFLVVAFACWATRTEKFPFTAMQMFSSVQRPEPVEYVRPMVVYEDGTREPARFERWIGSMADSRYRRLIRWDERPERVELLREFLDVAARRADASAPPGKRIERFELEHRRWDFRRAPADPDRGTLLGVLRHHPGDRTGGGPRGQPGRG